MGGLKIQAPQKTTEYTILEYCTVKTYYILNVNFVSGQIISFTCQERFHILHWYTV